LNGSTQHTGHDIGNTSGDHHEGGTADHNREEGHVSHEGTGQSVDDDFHSIPTTPAERQEGIPGSFE
jgi:hypothetical protein